MCQFIFYQFILYHLAEWGGKLVHQCCSLATDSESESKVLCWNFLNDNLSGKLQRV